MAVPDYTPTPVANCVDTPTVDTWLQNLNGLMEAGLQGTGGAACATVNGTLLDGECITIDTGAALKLSGLSEADGVIEKKIFLIAGRVSIPGLSQVSSEGGALPPTSQQLLRYFFFAKCGGVDIATSNSFTQQAGTTDYININMVAECVAGQELEFCLNVTGDTLSSGFNRPELSATLCGAVICISEPSRGFIDDIPGFYCAPKVPPGCLIGREGIHLLQQNLRALCAFAGQGYLESNCVSSVTFNDDDNHVLNQPTSDVQYLIVGSARVCASNDSNLPVTFSAQLTGGCTNGSTTRCFSVSQRLIRTGSDNGPGQGIISCFDVPLIACGNCLAGGSIFAGFNGSSICDETSLDGPQVTVESVTQQYTVFTFRRVDPVTEGLIPVFQEQPIDKCISRQSVEYLVEKSDALFDYFCQRAERPVGCTTIAEGFGPSTGGVVFSGVIRPPDPPPPVTVPPTPIPTSKVNVFCMVRVCFRNLSQFIGRTGIVRLTISCGGAAPFETVVSCFVPAPFQQSSDGAEQIRSDTICKNVPVITTYNGCLATIPVLLDIDVLAINVEATGSFECLSFNI